MNKEKDNLVTTTLSGKIPTYWSPLDYGFFYSPDKENVFVHGKYELRSFPNNMWLLRRKIQKDGKEIWSIKFYYMVLQEDIEFATWLLRKRLNKY